MRTMRREMRKKIREVCNKYLLDYSMPLEVAENFIDELTDAALSLRTFSFQPQTIDQAIFSDEPVTEDMLQRENLRDTAPKMFERALGFSKPLPWWNGKEWTAFGEWVCDRYTESKTSFGEYNIWRNTKYVKGAMSNNRIRGFVTEFYDSWDMFQTSRQKTDETRLEYIPYTDSREGLEFVSNPKAKNEH